MRSISKSLSKMCKCTLTSFSFSTFGISKLLRWDHAALHDPDSSVRCVRAAAKLQAIQIRVLRVPTSFVEFLDGKCNVWGFKFCPDGGAQGGVEDFEIICHAETLIVKQ